MNKVNLEHEHTPPQLSEINAQLSLLFEGSDLDEKQFLALVTQRDEEIAQYLLTLDDVQREQFVKAELKSNKLLTSKAESLFKASLKQLSGLVRGQKSVKKYK